MIETKPFHESVVDAIGSGVVSLAVNSDDINIGRFSSFLTLIANTSIPANKIEETVQKLEEHLQELKAIDHPPLRGLETYMAQTIAGLRDRLPATTEPIGEKGIAQVGKTANAEDGGILRL